MFATVQELYDAAQAEIGDEGGIFIDMPDVIRWYNEAVVDIYINAELGRDTPKTISLSQGAKVLDILGLSPGDLNRVHKIHSLVINGRPLKQTNLAELYNTVGYNINFDETGQPLYYWKEYVQTLPGDYTFKFWPACEVACNAVVSMTVLPEPIPPEVASSVDALSQIPLAFHKDVLKYIVMKGNLKEKDFRAAELHERQYQEMAFARYDTAHEVAEDFSTIQPDSADSYYGYLL